jgi:hypothetical protein
MRVSQPVAVVPTPCQDWPVFGLSKEQTRFQRSNKCPLCGKFPILPSYSLPNGKRLSPIVFLPTMARSAIATCKKCGGRWPVFEQGRAGLATATAAAPAADAAPAPVAAPVAPAAPAPAAPRPAAQVEIVETERTVEDDHVELMELDNLRGTSGLAREVTINEKWIETYVVDSEKARTIGGGAELGLGKILSLKASGEQALTRRYSATQGTERTYTDRITIEVPANTRRIVRFIYRRVWQHGLIVTREGDATVEIPFRVAVDLNLDLAQEDSTTPA